MKQAVLFVLLAVSIFVWAAPNPDEHPINVHVISSYFVASTGMFEKSVTVQKLSVLIDGKKYELSALATKAGLLTPGDYKAKLVRDEHMTAYESYQAYELVFPDKNIRKFFVTGQTE